MSEVATQTAAPNANHPLAQLGWVPLELTLETPLQSFTVQDLLFMQAGTVVRTALSQTSEVPFRVNGQLIGWAKLEVANGHLAARITELR